MRHGGGADARGIGHGETRGIPGRQMIGARSADGDPAQRRRCQNRRPGKAGRAGKPDGIERVGLMRLQQAGKARIIRADRDLDIGMAPAERLENRLGLVVMDHHAHGEPWLGGWSDVQPVMAGRDAEALAVAFGEMGMGAEARRHRHLDDGGGGIEQHEARPAQPDVAVIFGGGHAGVMAEQAMELAPGQARAGRQPVDAERRVEISLHGGDGGGQLLRAMQHRHAMGPGLLVHGGADAVDLQLLGDLDGEAGAMGLRDDMEEEIEGGRGAGAAVAVAIDDIEVVLQVDMRKIAGEGIGVLPMDRAGIAVEQPGPGQHIGAGGHGPQADPMPGEIAQPFEDRGMLEALRIEAAADEEEIRHQRHIRGAVDIQQQPIARLRGLALDGIGLPLVELLARQPVGVAHDIDGGDDPEQGEARQQQQSDLSGPVPELEGSVQHRPETFFAETVDVPIETIAVPAGHYSAASAALRVAGLKAAANGVTRQIRPLAIDYASLSGAVRY